MPDAASNVATVLTFASGVDSPGMIMPVWRGLQIVDDPYTKAKEGRRVLTAIMMVGWELVHGAAYKRSEVKLA